MKKFTNRFLLLAIFCISCAISTSSMLLSCTPSAGNKCQESVADALADTIAKITVKYPGKTGVAVIVNDEDTILVNDSAEYPMMSVFKLHQALAICDKFGRTGTPLDTILSIRRRELDADTWSPMLKEHEEEEPTLTVAELLRYTLIQSDNNASNLMFERLVDVPATDCYISTIIPRSLFKIAYTEKEMKADHDKAYSNFTSPSGAAILINKLFTDSLVAADLQSFIKTTLEQCATGSDRIAAPLLNKEGVAVAHKTGSGYRDSNGILAAHNDLAFVRLPDGRHYALGVFIKDFNGSEAEASAVIAEISATIYSYLQGKAATRGADY